MPELPDVENLRRGLSERVTGRRIMSVHVQDRKIFAAGDQLIAQQVTGRRVGEVSRRGKVLIISLEDVGSLLIHPKMTGQIVLALGGETVLAGGHPTPSMLEPMPIAATRVNFRLDRAGCLFYNDARRFGWIRLGGRDPCAEDPFLRGLGPEPWVPRSQRQRLATAWPARPRSSQGRAA
ncbi:MAG: DNA-formamidopyrimidine glycosylase family protein [Streptosporangiaceae bacterium]